MKEKFVKAVNNNDVEDVRLFLSNELMLDPRGESFHQMKALAESKIVDLYEEDNGGDYSTPQTAWDHDYLYRVKNDLDLNFSKKRLVHFEQVAKVVLSAKASALQDEEKAAATSSPRPNGKHSGYNHKQGGSSSGNMVVPTAVAFAGVALTVAGLCTSKVVITTVGVIGMVAGGFLYVKETRK